MGKQTVLPEVGSMGHLHRIPWSALYVRPSGHHLGPSGPKSQAAGPEKLRLWQAPYNAQSSLKVTREASAPNEWERDGDQGGLLRKICR